MNTDKLLISLDTSDDAAVYQLNEETALIQTLDFFTPVVDDPYLYGQIAAANSLSDVYAMGGQPLTAMNIVCFPSCLPTDILKEILKGGADKILEANALLVGGHTVEDDEPKYGLSVTGIAHPQKILANSHAKEGDYLILTKPLGTGILNTAIKADLCTSSQYEAAIKTMSTLNKYALEALEGLRLSACTDITGFGFLGHAYEMAKGSNVSLEIFSEKIPILEGVLEYAEMGIIPAGMYANKKHIEKEVQVASSIKEGIQDILYDPQTSGGLLFSLHQEDVEQALENLKAINKNDFAVVGRVVSKESHRIYVK
ncbi:selenide, water dikinase SelD [Clostridium aceticum]|uniref:Selenide, water dikinase n=2 Tax=Clostridium aceticum TaxID=84022 RepID=A0A0D8IDF1_9CLOT|nr:selenide, water dikinase SelD [Clostridium aceticum]KJF28002.1 segregation protein B [Clostridium aceticum]